MAVQGVLPPKFTPGTQNMGQLAALWKEYKGELELYFLPSGQDTIDDKQKVSLLLMLYQMGKQYSKVFENELIFAKDED